MQGRACRPNGKGSGEEGILSDVVPVYIYCPVVFSRKFQQKNSKFKTKTITLL